MSFSVIIDLDFEKLSLGNLNHVIEHLSTLIQGNRNSSWRVLTRMTSLPHMVYGEKQTDIVVKTLPSEIPTCLQYWSK